MLFKKKSKAKNLGGIKINTISEKPDVVGSVEKALTNISNIPIGTRIFNYGLDQSPALFNYYHAMLGGEFIPFTSAKDLWLKEHEEIDRLYTRIDHPVRGAVFVGLGGDFDPVHGHVGIVTADLKNGRFATAEQMGQAGQRRYFDFYVRNSKNILGFLLPKASDRY